MSKNLLFNIVITITVSYIGFCLFMYKQQYLLLYQPKTEKISPDQVDAKNIKIIKVRTSDNIVLEGWYFSPQEENMKTIVYFHGNGWVIGDGYQNVKYLLDNGYGLLMVEYRGYSGNKGKISEQRLYKDSRAFIDWLHNNKNIPYNSMIFYGESLGSALAIKMASEYNPYSVILFSAFSSMLDLAWERYPYIPVNILLKDQYRNDLIISKIKSPILFLHGQKDKLVPIKYGRKLFEKANKSKEMKIYEYGSHTNLYSLGAIEDIISFLNKTFKDE